MSDSKFLEFLKSQHDLYDETNTRLRTFVESKADLEWYNRFFGTRPRVRFIVVPGMANGGASYGPHFVGEDGTEEMYAIAGIWQVDANGLPQFDRGWRDVMVHEFVHSFSNPLVDKFASQMQAAAVQMNDEVKGAMRRQGYGDGKTLLYESMVRATTIQYVLDHDGGDAAQRLVAEDNSRSFYWIGDLADLLAVYKKQRQQYPTLESFMPRVVAFFNGVAPRMSELAKRYEQSRPKLISISVTNGGTDVNPALTQVTAKFSRAMSTADPSRDPRFRTMPFDDSRTVLMIPVGLEADHDYELWLRWPNGDAFTASDGTPIAPVLIRFRTRH